MIRLFHHTILSAYYPMVDGEDQNGAVSLVLVAIGRNLLEI